MDTGCNRHLSSRAHGKLPRQPVSIRNVQLNFPAVLCYQLHRLKIPSVKSIRREKNFYYEQIEFLTEDRAYVHVIVTFSLDIPIRIKIMAK